MKRIFLLLTIVAAQLFGALSAEAKRPTAQEALLLRPMQKDVEIDRPEGEAAKQCRIAEEKGAGVTALVVRGPAGELLRRFVDSNGDVKLDQWCYYKSGIEVYRDIDADFNGRADQYRWLGTAGTRWGLDKNEDGKIDAWKAISPEEVTAQVVLALQSKDKQRLQNVLLSRSEISSLGLGKQKAAELAERVQRALVNLDSIATKQKHIGKDTEWIDFGGLRPGVIPAGTDGAKRDVTVYENVVAMIETGGKPAQLPIGTLVRVGQGWRLVGLVSPDEGADASTRFVFFEAATRPDLSSGTTTEGISEETQKLVEGLEQLDQRLAKAGGAREIEELHGKRADALEALAAAAGSETNRDMWLMQLVDTVGAAAQSGAFPGGTKRLSVLREQLEKRSTNKELVSHIVFTHMSSEYAQQLAGDDVDFDEVQEKWLEQLEAFVEKYPVSRDAPEAMLQLALAKEFAGKDKDANKWYTRIVDDFEESPLAAKAAGAKRRLESIGKSLSLKGRTTDGKPFDISRLGGNVVLVHYWATWCEPCKQDMEVMAELRRKFARKRFQIVGINLDSEPDTVRRYFQSNRPQWTHLYEKGGLDSRLANEMGVFTLPLMLLVDSRGRVVNRQVVASEMERDIAKLLR